MRRGTACLISLIATLAIIVQALPLRAAEPASDSANDLEKTLHPKPLVQFKPEQQASKGSVTVAGSRIDYDAYAGTLVVHPKGWDDVPQNAPPDEDKNPRPEASMFYVAYFKSADKNATDKNAAPRPITFLFNGGPGSSTVWLHMGAFGPRRVVTADDTHTPAAPYSVVNNEFSLLDGRTEDAAALNCCDKPQRKA
jgi:carboxypeptidase C (cathepsin A)